MKKIQIKCTSCSQKFSVSESFKGKMVECGGCDHRFKIEGLVIVKQKRKNYPGENLAMTSNEFTQLTGNDSSKTTPASLVKFEPANYSQFPNLDYAAPVEPRRTAALIIGVVLILLFILVFLLEGREGGTLQNIDNTKRLLLTCFIAILGSGLILYGSRSRSKGLLTSLILGGALIVMPFVFPETLSPQRLSLASDDDTSQQPEQNDEKEIYTQGIGYRDIIKLRKQATDKGIDPTTVKAIVLRNVSYHIDTILFYVKNKLQLKTVPSKYTLGRVVNDKPITLMVFDSDASMEEVLEISKRFGTPTPMEGMLTDLGIIEINVDHKQFINQDAQILGNENHANYFRANYIELRSMDRTKQIEAIKRLNKTQASLGRRFDISTRLASLISVNDKPLSKEVIKTLNKWTLPDYNLDGIVLEYAKSLSAKGILDEIVMNYLVDKQIKGSSSILAQQWLRPKGYLRWEDQILRAKSQGEQAIIEALPKTPDSHIKSAAAILKKIGTAKSIPALRDSALKHKKEDANYLKATIDEIKSRQ